MSERADPFEVLRRPIAPVRPRPEFGATLRRQLTEELRMVSNHGQLQLVHLAVGDAEQAMGFFGSLFGWVGERYESDHLSYYTLNTSVTVRLLDDPNAAPVRPNYAVADVGAAVRAIESAGGRVTETETSADGGGWAFANDSQGLPLLVFRPYDRPASSSSAPVTGDVALLLMREDATAAAEFYGSVLGWRLAPPHSDGTYYDTVKHVGILGTADPPSMALHIEVPALRPAMERIVELGGSTGPVPDVATMGRFFDVRCTDDQGTAFGLISATVDEGDQITSISKAR